MEITELLSKDHDEVEQLFADFEATDSDEEREEIAKKVIRELSVHAAVEEQFVYPLVRAELNDGNDQVDEAIGEHADVKQLLSDLESQDPSSAEYRSTMTSVMQLVRHHVEEEEGEMFAQLRSATDADHRERLGDFVDKAKAAVPTHPHPLVPGTATAQLVAGPWATMVDKARDLLGAGPQS